MAFVLGKVDFFREVEESSCGAVGGAEAMLGGSEELVTV